MASLTLIPPAILPPLDPNFRPASLANRHYRRRVGAAGVPVVLGLEREDGRISRCETAIFPPGHPEAGENLPYVVTATRLYSEAQGTARIAVPWVSCIGGRAYPEWFAQERDRKLTEENRGSRG